MKMISESGEIRRKYQVFISSTFKDLEDHRQEAITGIVKAGHIPIALENFTPSIYSKKEVIYQAIEDCQFYVLILGHRYGTIPGGQGVAKEEKSYIEIELDHAESKGRKVLAFLMDENLAMESRRKLDPLQDKDELANTPKYFALRSRLTDSLKTNFHSIFEKARDIREELRVYFTKDHDIPGLIPELESGTDVNTILRISIGNPILREIVKRLGTFKSIEPRFVVAKEKKDALAKAFLELHGDDVQNRYHEIFFESGSTVAYLAKELSEKLPTSTTGIDKIDFQHVFTNNAFAYLYLWLCSDVLCRPEPEGRLDDKYGGMYGPLTGRNMSPDYSLPPLEESDPEGVKIIEKLSKDIFSESDKDKKSAIILAAASGLQIGDSIDAKYYNEQNDTTSPIPVDEETLKLLKGCRGFHVGSYRNRLFKRCYYLTGIPTVVFVHDEKIDCPILVRKCHFLFDKGKTWENFSESYPLSIWTVCEGKTHKSVFEKLKTYMGRGGWKFVVYGECSLHPIVIGHNESFRKACGKIGVKPRMV